MSYGTNAPQGLVPVYSLTNATFNSAQRAYHIPSGYGTSIFRGTPVILAANDAIVPYVIGSGTPIVGVFMGCEYQDTTSQLQYSQYWPASTAVFNGMQATAFLCDDPNVVFNIQAANSNGAGSQGITTTNINYNFDLGGQNIGSTITGLSTSYLDLNTQATTATLPFKLIGIVPYATNKINVYTPPDTFPYNNGLVIINNHMYKGGTGNVGV